MPQAARARSFAAFERELSQQERFFQVMDQQAPPFELSDPNGHSAGLAELRGKVIVLNFIYTLCPDICPLESERVAAIQRMVNPTKLRDQVRFVSITADPVRDTPPVMKAYGAQHGLDPANWIFLTSGADHPDTAVALSRAYHNRFLREADGSITHGVIFHVIDGAGRWRGNFHGLDWKPERLVMLMTELANHDHAGKEPSSSFWKRITDLL
ncbi:MAG: SCO family protein [Rhodospirillales bacterium]|nr:SCO family protein [Rhodospirillales bacterium]